MINSDDARMIALLMCSADGGCEHCAGALLEGFSQLYPEYTDIIWSAFKENFGWEAS